MRFRTLFYLCCFEFLLILYLLILQVLDFVLEDPELLDQALKQNTFEHLADLKVQHVIKELLV